MTCHLSLSLAQTFWCSLTTLSSISQSPVKGTLLTFKMLVLWPIGRNLTTSALMRPNQSWCLLLVAVAVAVSVLILLQGARLEQVHHFKYLGVWLSDDLTLKKHIEYITNRARLQAMDWVSWHFEQTFLSTLTLRRNYLKLYKLVHSYVFCFYGPLSSKS